MLRHLLPESPLRIEGDGVGADVIEAVGARIDEVTNEPQDILEREPLVSSLASGQFLEVDCRN
jgi:hypothetical protein